VRTDCSGTGITRPGLKDKEQIRFHSAKEQSDGHELCEQGFILTAEIIGESIPRNVWIYRESFAQIGNSE